MARSVPPTSPGPGRARSPSSRHLASIRWQEIRKLALVRNEYQCTRCGTRAHLEVHHRVPVSGGGTDDLENLETRCRGCHEAEHRRLAAVEPD